MTKDDYIRLAMKAIREGYYTKALEHLRAALLTEDQA
jgi:hypothetical protein